jgi:hypothetical protein
LENSQNPSSPTASSEFEQDTSGEGNSSAGDGTERRGCRRRGYRIAVINPKRFSDSSISTISMKGLVPKIVFILDTRAQPNLVEARCLHPDTQILREDKYIGGITDGYVESLGSIQISFKGHPITIDVIPDECRIPQGGILGMDFLKECRPVHIRYDEQMARQNHPMYNT